MTKNINHWCIVCGKGYHACDSCNEVKTFKPWRIVTDTSEHYRVYRIIIDFRDGFISKEQARMSLSDIDLSNRKSFKPDVQAFLSQILDESDKEDKTIIKEGKAKANPHTKSNKIGKVVKTSENADTKKTVADTDNTDDK